MLSAHHFLSKYYGQLGGFIARHRVCFILIPLSTTLLLSLGILNISYRRDLFNLFTPSNGRTKRDLQTMEDLFAANVSTQYDLSRLLKEGMYITLLATALDGKTILREEVYDEIRQIDYIVRSVAIDWKGKKMNYSQICATNFGKCVENVELLTDDQIRRFHTNDFSMKYPVEIDPITYKVTPYAQCFGGVQTDDEGNIHEVLAYRLFYVPDKGRFGMKDALTKWERKTLEAVAAQHFEFIKVSSIASSHKEALSMEFTQNVVHLSGVSTITIVVFCILVSMTTDWVKSKPWLGVSACVSAALASISAFGLMAICGVSYIDMNIALPFLLLGMGIDDSFILLSAWRRTSSKNKVEDRMVMTYTSTATSITITSFTNFISFAIGLTSSFPVVQTFCLYAATGVLFTFIYQITFYGACLVLTGEREAKGIHPFTCQRIKGNNLNVEMSSDDNSVETPDLKDANTEIFGSILGTNLSKAPIKILITVLYLGGVAFSMNGLISIKEGLDIRDVIPKSSTATDYMNDNYMYFTKYAHRIHIAITEPLNYADIAVQTKIEDLLRRFEANSLIADPSLTESWLRAFKMFADSEVSSFSLGAFNISLKQDFIDGLRVFLRFPQTRNFQRDIIFNDNFTEIVASRFFLLCNDVKNKEEEKDLLETVWNVADSSEISLTPYSYWFTFYEQLSLIKPATIQTLSIAAGAVMLVFFTFIPDVTCCLLVAATILTIQIEVVGFMAVWNISLDIFSLMNLIMCIGFSVNYPAHLTFAYVTAGYKDANSRLKHALSAVGFPIIQGSLSTLIGVSILIIDSSYMFTVFIKIAFLVVTLTAIHSIFVLPVALHTLDRLIWFTPKTKDRVYTIIRVT